MSSFWTPQPHSRGVVLHCRQWMQSATFALCVFALSACGQSSSGPAATNESGTSIAAVNAPPGAGDRPAPLGSTGAPKDANGLPVLAPRGVNSSQLFVQKLDSSDDRMLRLENAVQELRNDFDAVAPSIVRLVAVEKDIQELVAQLETLVAQDPVPVIDRQPLSDASETPVPPPAGEPGADGAPLPLSSELPVMTEDTAAAGNPPPATPSPPSVPEAPPPPTPAPAPAPVTPPAAAPAPAPAAAGIVVTGIRFGEHPGKTRIVLDLSARTDYTADVDNAEKILVVDLPGAGWSGAMQKTLSGSPFIVSYQVSPGTNGKGSLLVLKLKSDAAILYKGVMNADSGAGAKIVLDIGKAAAGAVPTQ